MAACARIDACPLFKQFSMKSSLKVWQAYYCEGDWSRCARWKLVDAGRPVPMNLLPNGRMLTVPMDHLAPHHLS
jgi:hypothetical protein